MRMGAISRPELEMYSGEVGLVWLYECSTQKCRGVWWGVYFCCESHPQVEAHHGGGGSANIECSVISSPETLKVQYPQDK